MRAVYDENGLGSFGLIHTGEGTNHIDRDVEVGTSYGYRLDKTRGVKTFTGKDVALSGRTREPPLAGEIAVERGAGDQEVTLTWLPDGGADSYIVTKSTKTGEGLGEFVDIYQGNLTVVVDRDVKGAAGYGYRLDKTRDGERISGEAVTVFNPEAPEPGGISAERIYDGTSIVLRWEADNRAEGYIIKRITVGAYGIDFTAAGAHTVAETATNSVTTYIDNNLSTEESYAYRLDKKRGAAVIEGTGIALSAETRPAIFRGSIQARSLDGGRMAHLSWERDPGADQYRIMRLTDDGSGVEFLERTSENGLTVVGETSAIDSGLRDDRGYFYRLDKKRRNEGADGWVLGEVTVFSQTRPPPFADAPAADGFRDDNGIYLSWRYDEGADEYIVTRKKDGPLGFESVGVEVYRGTGQHYLDANIDSDKGRYTYRLDKSRNGVRVEGLSAYVVAAQMMEESREPNDDTSHAVVLEDIDAGNLYYFVFSDERIIEDMDWYKINIPPHKRAKVAVHYNNFLGAGQGGSGVYFNLLSPPNSLAQISQDTPFYITNNGMFQDYIYFRLSPIPLAFVDPGTPGGDIVGYTVEILEIGN
jgi:hypothetical protein